MRIMLDTNILISHFIFDSKTIKTVVDDIATRHKLQLSTFVIDEFRAVVSRKWPNRIDAVERFLQEASYEVVVTPLNPEPDLFKIRDLNDYPVLYSAIIGFADILLTGDKDFGDIEIESPLILTPVQYAQAFLS